MDRIFCEQLLISLSLDDKKKISKNLARKKISFPGFTSLENVPTAYLTNYFLVHSTAFSVFLESVIEAILGKIKKTQYEQVLEQPPTPLQIPAYFAIYALLEKENTLEAKELLTHWLSTKDSLDENVEKDSLLQDEFSEAKTPTTIEQSKGKTAMKYIGYIKRTTSNKGTVFCMFHPVATFENNLISALLNPQEEFPTRGDINLYCFDKSASKMKKFLDDRCYLVDLDYRYVKQEENRLNGGSLNPTNIKINAEELVRMQAIQSLDSQGIYFVVTSENEKVELEGTQTIYLHAPTCPEGSMVLVRYDDMLIGPFELKCESDTDRFYVSIAADKQDYLLDAYYLIGQNIFERVTPLGVFALGNGNVVYQDAICLDSSFEKKKIDCISDEVLLAEFAKIQLSKDESDSSDVSQRIEIYEKSALAQKTCITADILENRLNRIKIILTQKEQLYKNRDSLSEVFNAAIISDNTLFSDLRTRLFDDDDFFTKIQSHRMIQEKNRVLKEKQDSLEREIAALEAKKKAEENEEEVRARSGKIAEEYQKEIEKLTAQTKHQTELLLRAQKEYAAIAEGLDLNEKVKIMREDVKYLERRKTELGAEKELAESKVEAAKNEIHSVLNGAKSKAAEIAFDGMISSKMLQAATAWETVNEQSDIEKRISTLSELPLANRTGQELADYLYEEVIKYRKNYSKNSIINLFICTAQGFLTIFSGEPGTGKTSICNIIGHVLGLSQIEELLSEKSSANNRYISVSVERGWTSKRDLIGYYNPLTRSFDSSDAQVYKSLKGLAIEATKDENNFPFFVLLDEANLSPMEYYWADFMNVCDDLNDKSSINVGEETRLRVAKTLRFVATINNDHTTEILSPRLIDRAWVITLLSEINQDSEELKLLPTAGLVSWSSFEETFITSSKETFEDTEEVPEILSHVYNLFKDVGVTISPRVDMSVRKYWSVAQNYFEDEGIVDKKIVAIDYAIAQKILPKINGTGIEYKQFLSDLKIYCTNRNLIRSKEILNNILNKGQQMDYYKFFN